LQKNKQGLKQKTAGLFSFGGFEKGFVLVARGPLIRQGLRNKNQTKKPNGLSWSRI
jgi:hypothetical protein